MMLSVTIPKKANNYKNHVYLQPLLNEKGLEWLKYPIDIMKI